MRFYESLRKFMKVYESLRKFTKVYESLRKFTIVYKSYDIPRYCFGQIPCFRSVSFTCDVVFAFCNFVQWWTKFSCLLSFRIASRQYRQIFRHRHRPGISSNIADTYSTVVNRFPHYPMVEVLNPGTAFGTQRAKWQTGERLKSDR